MLGWLTFVALVDLISFLVCICMWQVRSFRVLWVFLVAFLLGYLICFGFSLLIFLLGLLVFGVLGLLVGCAFEFPCCVDVKWLCG